MTLRREKCSNRSNNTMRIKCTGIEDDRRRKVYAPRQTYNLHILSLSMKQRPQIQKCKISILKLFKIIILNNILVNSNRHPICADFANNDFIYILYGLCNKLNNKV